MLPSVRSRRPLACRQPLFAAGIQTRCLHREHQRRLFWAIRASVGYYIMLSLTLKLRLNIQLGFRGFFHFKLNKLTGVAWCCSSPHTSWALWCCSAHGICSHTFGNGTRSKETSGKCRRTPVSGMFSEPAKDRSGLGCGFWGQRRWLKLSGETLEIPTKLCVVRGTWSRTSTSSSSPMREVESVFQSIRNFLLRQMDKKMKGNLNQYR